MEREVNLMLLTLNIPDDIANRLGVAHCGDVARSTVEKLALAGYQDGHSAASKFSGSSVSTTAGTLRNGWDLVVPRCSIPRTILKQTART